MLRVFSFFALGLWVGVVGVFQGLGLRIWGCRGVWGFRVYRVWGLGLLGFLSPGRSSRLHAWCTGFSEASKGGMKVGGIFPSLIVLRKRDP